MKSKLLMSILLSSLVLVACINEQPTTVDKDNAVEETPQKEDKTDIPVAEANGPDAQEEKPNKTETSSEIDFKGYKLIKVDACDLSGHREANVVVDIGFGDREYWAFTNEHGQLIKVIADEIILQDDNTEKITSSGRYCNDEAKVPGVESKYLDEGHVIADSLGGNSSAYNITPQESTLNRHGDQAYMEEVIRKAGGATNFEAIVTYPDNKTQIPSKYKYTYTVKGNTVTDEFENVNPDEVNKSLGLTNTPPANNTTTNNSEDVSKVDTNGNGIVTIKEAKAAGFKMPISREHWLYKYMQDNDGDGFVGE